MSGRRSALCSLQPDDKLVLEDLYVADKETCRLYIEVKLADTVIKLGAYYLHERTWMRVSFGKLKTPEYQI